MEEYILQGENVSLDSVLKDRKRYLTILILKVMILLLLGIDLVYNKLILNLPLNEKLTISTIILSILMIVLSIVGVRVLVVSRKLLKVTEVVHSMNVYEISKKEYYTPTEDEELKKLYVLNYNRTYIINEDKVLVLPNER